MSLLGAMVPPAAGVMCATYWVINKGKVDAEAVVPDYKWIGIVSWVLGAVIAAVPVVLSFFPQAPHFAINPLTGIVVSLVAYLVLHKFAGNAETEEVDA